MELPDCPPGTEGYQDSIVEVPKKQDVTSTKAEAEFYEHLKSLQIQTDNGMRCLSDRQERDIGGQWVYLCYPCGVQCAGEAMMQAHLLGKKHENKISSTKVWPTSIFSNHPYFAKPSKTSIRENLKGSDPNERYMRFKQRECAIQKTLDEVKAPMIGLEYLIEFPSDDAKCNTYMCTLCNIHGHPRTIVDHYTSFRHRLTYFRYHFTKAIQMLGPYNYQRCYHEGVGVVVHRLALRIEDKYGRQRPLCIDKEVFDAEKEKICQWIARGFHFSERQGPTFEEVIDINLITSLITSEKSNVKPRNDLSKRDPSPPKVAAPTRPKIQRGARTESLDSLSDISGDEKDSRLSHPTHRSKRSPYSRSSRYNPYHDNRNNSPRHHFSGRGAPLEVKDKKDDPKLKFKHKMAEEKTTIAEEAAKKILAYHEKNPEKHPQYPEEWKKFWNRRYKELQAEGKDPSKYDFKPEWIVFWTNRMKELHEEELRVNVTEIYRKFGLSPPPRHKDPTRRSPEPHSRTLEPRRRSPEPRRRSPELRRRSPEPRRRSPEPRRRSPEPRRRSPEPRRRSPEPRRRSPEPRRRSPEFRRRSLETRRSPNAQYPSPVPQRRSPTALNKQPPVRARSRSPVRPKKPAYNPRIELQSLNRRSQSPLSRRDAHRNRSPQPVTVESNTVVISDEELKPDGGLSPWDDSDHSFGSLGSLPDANSPIVRPRSRTNSIMSRNSYRQATTRTAPRVERHDTVYETPKMGDPSDEVVPTLRLLVALEDHLGSLGPKIVELLTEALKMEKEKPNSSEELLDREGAVALMETAKEKLKGVTQAGLVSGAAAAALRSAVVRVAALLHEADRRAKRAQEKQSAGGVNVTATKVGEAVSVAGVGAVDKAEIAAQMAAALVAQGKTDVSAEELAQLVDAVVGMAEAKKREAEATQRMAAAAVAAAAATAAAASATAPATTLVLSATTTPAPTAPAASISLGSAAASALQLLQTAYDENEKKAEAEAVAADPIDGLSDSDLETLLKNFNELSAEEQHSLIAYLKKLEAKDPRRVERLREYVDAAAANATLPETTQAPIESNLPSLAVNPPAPVPAAKIDPSVIDISRTPVTTKSEVSTHKSPQIAHKPTPSAPVTTVSIDSDDDDYTVEEVLQSAKEKEIENIKKSTIMKKDVPKSNPSKNLKSFTFPTSLSSSADLLALVQAAVQAKPQDKAAPPATASIDTNTKPISFGDHAQETYMASIPSMMSAPGHAEPRQFIDTVESRRYSAQQNPPVPHPTPYNPPAPYPAPQDPHAPYPQQSHPMPQWSSGPRQAPPQFMQGAQQARPWFDQDPNINHNNVRQPLMNGRGPQPSFRPRNMNYGNMYPNKPGRGRGHYY